MATFYLLPPRAVLGQRLLATLGIPHTRLPLCAELAESLGKAVEATGAYVVYRDDLPPGDELIRTLIDGFGAESGDEIIEVAAGEAPRRWRLAA
jgi:hypothetical protein